MNMFGWGWLVLVLQPILENYSRVFIWATVKKNRPDSFHESSWLFNDGMLILWLLQSLYVYVVQPLFNLNNQVFFSLRIWGSTCRKAPNSKNQLTDECGIEIKSYRNLCWCNRNVPPVLRWHDTQKLRLNTWNLWTHYENYPIRKLERWRKVSTSFWGIYL